MYVSIFKQVAWSNTFGFRVLGQGGLVCSLEWTPIAMRTGNEFSGSSSKYGDKETKIVLSTVVQLFPWDDLGYSSEYKSWYF